MGTLRQSDMKGLELQAIQTSVKLQDGDFTL